MKSYEEIITDTIEDLKNLTTPIPDADISYLGPDHLRSIEHEFAAKFGLDGEELFRTYDEPSEAYARLVLTLTLRLGEDPKLALLNVIHSCLVLGTIVGVRIQTEKGTDPR
jgi:hypothetical protein